MENNNEKLSILLLLTLQALKRKLPVIGKSANPRYYKNVKSLPVDYISNKKARMTSDIWLDYLKNFGNRKILLFVDNCTAHRNVSLLKSIKLQYLPPKRNIETITS